MKVIRYKIKQNSENIKGKKDLLLNVELGYSTENELLAKNEAYNDEYEIIEVPDEQKESYIPTPEQSAVVMMRSIFATKVADMEDEEVLMCSGLADEWEPGNYNVGDIYNANNQTWECHQKYNNAEYPDITPDNSSWFTFNRPLHGKSIETARPWVKPQYGTTDIYKVGEYMVYIDGFIYKCIQQTNFSPEEYIGAWEKIS